MLEKASVQAARDQIAADFGTGDILINGAGGNNPKATTDDEYFVPEDLGQMKTFFDLDADGVSFVFSLNFMGCLLYTSVSLRILPPAQIPARSDSCPRRNS